VSEEDLFAAVQRHNLELVAVRSATAVALGQLGAPAVDALLDALTDANSVVRELAAKALDTLGWTPDRTEKGAAYHAAKEEWDECVAIGGPAVEPLILALTDVTAREWAAEALGRIGDARAVEPLIGVIDEAKDSDYAADRELCAIAAEALRRLDDPRAAKALAGLPQS
jgi:HEAT repeat protein